MTQPSVPHEPKHVHLHPNKLACCGSMQWAQQEQHQQLHSAQLHISRCCKVTRTLSVVDAANRRPNAALPLCGTPSQNEYACVAGLSVGTSSMLAQVISGSLMCGASGGS